ncbi:hypothetical protein BN2497_5327 [Janthinobacterium sp. CG23_2]|nr:hypothetical protein BN2497_5327 [Janthinobacterium sp. CG23_2]CUU29061.1 hypothetical protein BN3177_5327 [Janthinobacterium sp. CG23_2]
MHAETPASALAFLLVLNNGPLAPAIDIIAWPEPRPAPQLSLFPRRPSAVNCPVSILFRMKIIYLSISLC